MNRRQLLKLGTLIPMAAALPAAAQEPPWEEYSTWKARQEDKYVIHRHPKQGCPDQWHDFLGDWSDVRVYHHKPGSGYMALEWSDRRHPEWAKKWHGYVADYERLCEVCFPYRTRVYIRGRDPHVDTTEVWTFAGGWRLRFG